MPLLSQYAQTRKIEYFLNKIPKQARILEIGSGSGWVYEYLKQNGYNHYVGIDLEPPADVVGDIRDWKNLGLKEQSFDVIVAFEVVEHVNCFKECFDLLKPGGMLMITSPVPHMDWAMQLLELVGLNQKRTSPHEHLVYFEDIPFFKAKDIRRIGFLSQWGILSKLN
jgi:2-polyprenyl-3-methyl-5-hydroxy-6-metoxy-1,4-benzoquinol methylase